MDRDMSGLTKGAKYKHGTTWHDELSDKAAAIRTHVNFIIRAAAGNPQSIKDGIDNIVDHYKNKHDHCLPQSRCKTDQNHELSKIIITDDRAAKLLKNYTPGFNCVQMPTRLCPCHEHLPC